MSEVSSPNFHRLCVCLIKTFLYVNIQILLQITEGFLINGILMGIFKYQYMYEVFYPHQTFKMCVKKVDYQFIFLDSQNKFDQLAYGHLQQ